jgi:phosphoribosylaminoimidazolecarboxamide formyltransferase/IMP cyclohydrolase
VAIDMVVVNLYPFRQTVARPGVTVEEARANIDIGGPCMIRASAKNYLRVAPVVDPADYARLVGLLRRTGGKLDLATRFGLARKAFAHTAAYDAAIAAFLEPLAPEAVRETYAIRG